MLEPALLARCTRSPVLWEWLLNTGALTFVARGRKAARDPYQSSTIDQTGHSQMASAKSLITPLRQQDLGRPAKRFKPA
jgi:hypothetical protein